MRVRTYCFPGCFTRPPGTSTRNHPCQTTTSKPVVPRGSLVSMPILRVQGAQMHLPSPAGRCERCWPTCALTKTTRPRATWGALRHVVSVRSLRDFRAAGLATPGPRSLRLGSASRGNLGRRPTAVKTPRMNEPASSADFASSRSAILDADADHRAPGAARLAPVGPRAVRAAERRPARSCASSATARRSPAPRAMRCSTPSRPTGTSTGSACGAPPRATSPMRAWASSGLAVPSFLPAVLPAVEVGWRLARPAWGRGLATEGARASLAPCLPGPGSARR